MKYVTDQCEMHEAANSKGKCWIQKLLFEITYFVFSRGKLISFKNRSRMAAVASNSFSVKEVKVKQN